MAYVPHPPIPMIQGTLAKQYVRVDRRARVYRQR